MPFVMLHVTRLWDVAWRVWLYSKPMYAVSRAAVVIMGGLVLNGAFLKALERISGIKFVIPDDPVFAGAIGAAMLAAEQ